MNLNIKFTSDFEFVKSIISLPTQIYRPYMQKVNLYNFNLMFLTLNLQYLNSDFVSKLSNIFYTSCKRQGNNSNNKHVTLFVV